MDFLDRLKYIISKADLNKNTFAEICGISRTQLFRYLNGKQEPGTLFYRNLKQNFPWVDLGWLIAGIRDTASDTGDSEKIIKPEKITKLTQYMMKLENNSPEELNEVEQFLKYRISVSKKEK